jgi:alkylation response protein AidB-like acyl-CoA dehydrogenase
MVGPAIQRFGTDEQRAKYLPKIWNNEITCALGYSEPNAGTDLASLKTRAVRDGDEYIINGQKIWTSGAHRCNHVWLAVRTDPDAPKHRGISVFLVPLNTPGITIRPIWVLADERTNEVFYDNVRVPAHSLIGEENRGWYIMANALDHERVTVGVYGYVDVVHVFEAFVDYLAHERPDLLAHASVRQQVADLKMQLHVCRALLLTCTGIIANGGTPTKESSMLKVWNSEFRYAFASAAMDILGRSGATWGADAPSHGLIERMYRGAPVGRFAAGTNEVQRDIIAHRGLGLPRQ